MNHRTNRRGSALLMVVGLLAMIALLGVTFLVITRLDAKQSDALISKAQADPLAAGVVSQVMSLLRDTLAIDNAATLPYTSGGGWTKFAICPDPSGVTDFKFVHVWDPDAGTKRLSNLQGTSATEVNMDGDAANTKDGYLVDTNVANAKGYKYWVSAKVVDLSGLLCVNVHGESAPAMSPKSVTNVNLSGCIPADYVRVNQTRGGAAATSPPIWWEDAARQLLEPANGRKPFPIGDEMWLRWLGTPSLAEAGSLYGAMKSSAAKRPYLTTFSCYRNLLRHPSGSFDRPVPAKWMNGTTSFLGDTERNFLRDELRYAFAGGTGGSGTPGETIVMDPPIDNGKAGFQQTGSPWILYSGIGYGGSVIYTNDKNGIENAQARWSINGLPAGSKVKVRLSNVPNATKRGTQIPVRIYDGPAGGSPKATTTVNQRAGTWHEVFSDVVINSGTVTVEISDAGVADGDIIADACEFTVTKPDLPPPPSNDVGPEVEHFLMNVKAAYMPYTAATQKAFEWEHAAGKKVYGLVNQPFITEAFAQHRPDTNNGSDQGNNDHRWGCAIKIINPTSQALTLTNYYVKGLTGTPSERQLSAVVGTDTFPGVASGSPTPNVLILYDMGGGSAYTPADLDFNFKQGNAGKWHKCEGLRFLTGKTIELVRRAESKDVPIDSISSSELGYSYSDTDITMPLGGPDKKANARRDDVLTRGRYSVAVYKKTLDSEASHHLNDANTGVTTTDIPLTDNGGEWCPTGFHVEVPHAAALALRPKSPGDLGQLFVAGARHDSDLPHVLRSEYRTKNLRGRLDFRTSAKNGASRYPDVPWPTLLGELLQFSYLNTSGQEVLAGDTTRSDDPRNSRVYGRINVNTAPKQVLAQLPWPPNITIGNATFTVNVNALVDRVIAYRDRKDPYTNREAIVSGRGAIDNLRTTSKYHGFLTPGEIAIPLADYADSIITDTLKNDPHKDYFAAVNKLYGAVANLITVNSDVFAVNIRVQLVRSANNIPADTDPTWYYVGVVDRSNCFQKTDSPALLLFSQVR